MPQQYNIPRRNTTIFFCFLRPCYCLLYWSFIVCLHGTEGGTRDSFIYFSHMRAEYSIWDSLIKKNLSVLQYIILPQLCGYLILCISILSSENTSELKFPF